MRYNGPRNRGGWPAKKKTIFDAAVKRRADKAFTHLAAAQEFLSATCEWLDPPVNLWMDLGSRDAWEMLQDAKRRVDADYDAANKLAASRETR